MLQVWVTAGCGIIAEQLAGKPRLNLDENLPHCLFSHQNLIRRHPALIPRPRVQKPTVNHLS